MAVLYTQVAALYTQVAALYTKWQRCTPSGSAVHPSGSAVHPSGSATVLGGVGVPVANAVPLHLSSPIVPEGVVTCEVADDSSDLALACDRSEDSFLTRLLRGGWGLSFVRLCRLGARGIYTHRAVRTRS